jgi:tRNA A37 methylthiotransferase MiaB
MKRGYTVEQFFDIVKRFRSAFQDITLSTDIIVGFPTETDTQFNESLNVIELLHPSLTNISKFSPREQTPATELSPLSSQTVKDRSRKMTALCKKITREKNKEWIGREETILIVSRGKKGGLEGRTYTYKPVIIDTQNHELIGTFVNVSIIDAKYSHLLGNLI